MMPADPTLSPALLVSIESKVRGAAKEGITSAHLLNAIADERMQIARHLQALISGGKIKQLGETLFSPANAPS